MTPRRPEPLPPELSAGPFRTSDARLLGLTEGRMRASDLDGSVWGVRVVRPLDGTLRERCAAFAQRMPPEAFFSHSTAARLWGIPIPPSLERMSRIHVSVPAPRRAPHADGLIGHSRHVVPEDVVDVGGLRVSAPPRVVCEMASVLGLPDLVAAVDRVIFHRAPLASLESIADRIRCGDRIARNRRLGAALALADARAESAPESRLRTLLTLGGIAGWVANLEVADPSTGRTSRIDLALPERRLGLEYQGDHHRSPEQWRRDLTRRSRLESLGWRVVELGSDDLRNPDELVARVRRFLS